jgi:hypothetical protein
MRETRGYQLSIVMQHLIIFPGGAILLQEALQPECRHNTINNGLPKETLTWKTKPDYLFEFSFS